MKVTVSDKKDSYSLVICFPDKPSAEKHLQSICECRGYIGAVVKTSSISEDIYSGDNVYYPEGQSICKHKLEDGNPNHVPVEKS